MHHKFAIFDQSILLTGSYNWTRSASEKNEENFIITSDPALLFRFESELVVSCRDVIRYEGEDVFFEQFCYWGQEGNWALRIALVWIFVWFGNR